MPFIDNVLNRGKAVGKKAVLKTDIMILDRTIITRKKRFGIDLYTDLNDITCQQDFYATTDATISIIRPELLSLDREIRALDGKRLCAKGNLDLAQAIRREAFPSPAANWKEKAANASKGAGFAANEAKIKTEMKVIETQLNAMKEQFGIRIFPILQSHFGTSAGPTEIHSSTDAVVNRIRERYQTCKSEIIEINRKKIQKEAIIDQLDVDVSLRRI
jgi:hypothetical protein